MKKILLVLAVIVSSSSLAHIWLSRPNTGGASPPFETTPIQKIDDTELGQIKQEIADITGKAQGEFGVVVEYLESEQRVEVNANKPFYAASLSKVPLLITLYRLYETDPDNFYPEKKITYLERDSEWGDGTIQDSAFGTEYTLEKVAWHLAKESDNTAKNILYRVLPWKEILKTYESAGVAPNTEKNIFTTQDMAKFWQVVWENDQQEIFDLLTNTKSEERIPSAVPDEIRVSHKIGTWSQTGSWHDCGIVFTKEPVLVCIMSQGSTYSKAVTTIKDITKIATDF